MSVVNRRQGASKGERHVGQQSPSSSSTRRLAFWKAQRAKQSSSLPVARYFILVMFLLIVVEWTNERRCRLFWNGDVTSVSKVMTTNNKPLVVHLPTHTSLRTVTRLSLQDQSNQFISHKQRKNHYWIDHNKDESIIEAQEHAPTIAPEGCVVEDWVYDLHPSCLQVHSIDMADFFFNANETADATRSWDKFHFITKGGYRMAFMFSDFDGTPRVLKTLALDKNHHVDLNFTEWIFELMRRDAVISEQLTSSPYIADMYAMCGLSAVMDHSCCDTLEFALVATDNPMPKDVRFQVAHDVAQSIADLHQFNPEMGRAAVIHFDMKPDQWLYLDERYKLNDFNLVHFLTWDPVQQEYCHLPLGYGGVLYHPPEHFLKNTLYTDKFDVYALGNVLGRLLTDDWPTPIPPSPEELSILTTGGTIWNITDRTVVETIFESTHPFDVAVRQAMQMCLVHDQEKRPHAQEVADFLRKALSEYEASKRQQQ